jgi:hypothetical protein
VPWNPVRLIQRIGRIDRLGSEHDVIFSYAFLPDGGLERLLGLLERVRRKLHTIRSGVGLEAEVGVESATEAHADTEHHLDRLARGDPTLLDELERRDTAPFESEERLRLRYVRACADAPADRARAAGTGEPIPIGTMGSSGRFVAGSTLVGVRARDAVRVVTVAPGRTPSLDEPAALDLLASAIAAEGDPGTASLRELPLFAKAEGAGRQEHGRGACDDVVEAQVRRAAAVQCIHGAANERHGGFARVADALAVATSVLRPRGAMGGVAPSARKSVTMSAIRCLLRALSRVPGGADADLCARAESVIQRLSRGGPAGLEQDLRAVLAHERASGLPAAELCSALEAILTRSGVRSHSVTGVANQKSGEPELEWLAAIELI